ncbi:AAA family ATPase, partial [Streptomyces sp. SID7499]|nr:AAA family ATPase [Streptomyces sp. SID7499]
MLTNAPSVAPVPTASAPVPTDSAPVSQLAVADALMSLLRDTTTEPRPDIQLEALTLAVSADLPVL